MEKKVESPDVPKEDGWLGKLAIEEAKKHNIGTSSSFTWRHAFCVGYSHQEKELADLRAERDKLKEKLREHRTTQNKLLSANSYIQRLKADNERLKEKLETNVENWMEFKFTSELTSRWPDKEAIECGADEYANKHYGSSTKGRAGSFIDGVEWLKSYLENK